MYFREIFKLSQSMMVCESSTDDHHTIQKDFVLKLYFITLRASSIGKGFYVAGLT